MKNDKQQSENMKAIKKPIPVEFVRLEKTPQSIIEVYRFINGPDSVKLTCNAAHDAWDNYSDDLMNKGYMSLKTLESGEGTQNANFGDYILKGIDGECWPVKPDVFERTYDVKAPLSNETKVVESIEQMNHDRFEEILRRHGVFEYDVRIYPAIEEYASQFKNTDAVKVNQSIEQYAKEYASESLPHEKGFLAGVSCIIKIINNEKITLERQSDKEQFSQFSRIDEKIDVINHILKLIQP